MGIRIDEWDAREPEVVNPVRLHTGTGEVEVEVEARLVFELVIPQGAEVLGTYQADFYAGTPAVTRNTFGAGHGWYVATGLDQVGVATIVRQVLAHHDLLGPYPNTPDLETTVRIAPDGTRLVFLLNHGDQPVELPARSDGTDLLSGDAVTCGQPVILDPHGVLVLRESAG
jgi:beta-galactosidase